MTKDEVHEPIPDLNEEIAKLIDKFGRGRLLTTAIKTVVRFKPSPPRADHLDNRMRRDIGLPERPHDPIDHFWDLKR